MTRIVAVSEPGYDPYGEDDATVIARALARFSAPAALAAGGRALVVEPRSDGMAGALRAAGFAGELVALASVPIGEAYGVAGGFARVVVDDWAERAAGRGRLRALGAATAPRLPETPPLEMRLGMFQCVIITDLTRYLVAGDAPGALRWLARRLSVQGLLAVADPALTLTPERLADALNDTGLAMATAARVLGGDWPRTLTFWRRWAPAEQSAPEDGQSTRTAGAWEASQRAGRVLRLTPLLASSRGTGAPAPTGPDAATPFHRDRMLARSGQLTVTARPGTGLVVVAAADGALLPDERAAISRYRLQQYVLANLYSAELVERWSIREDPSMALLNANDTHFVAATADGVIAAYLCLQTASSALTARAAAASAAFAAANSPWLTKRLSLGAMTLSELDRPMFPVETEYGDLFARHPGLKTLPVTSVREITRLVRNQRPDLRARLRDVADIAVAEAIVASAHFVRNPAHLVEAIIGCIAPEARQALLNYRIPVAYAPDAPIYGENLGGGSAEGPLIWTDESRETGRFWPFAISALDIRRERDYFLGLEEALDGPTTREVREALNALRRRTPLRAPRFAASFRYQGYREDIGRDGYAQVALPVAWVGLEARPRPAYEHNVLRD